MAYQHNGSYSANQFMNPGPAPRPPTDRSASGNLSLTRSNPSIPSNTFDTMTLGPGSPPVQTPTTQYFPNTSSLSLGSATKTSSTPNVIKEGYVRCKEDKFLAGWNRRYLILREYRLDFMKDENGKLVQSIPLNTVTGVSRSEEVRMAFEIARVAGAKDNAGKAAINRDLPTKSITCEVRSDDEIYEWIDKIYERCPGMGGVSNPTNFSHRIHVGFDPQTGGFVGLPQEWEKLLTASAITKEDYKKNPQAVIEVLEFYSEHKMREQHPEMYPHSIPTPPAMQQNKQLGFPTGNSVAPPRPAPPTEQQRYNTSQFMNKFTNSSPGSGHSPAKPSLSRSQTDKAGYDMEADAARIKEIANQEQERIRREAEAKRKAEADKQREKDADQGRRDQDNYNSSIPKTRTPLAQQEVAGGSYTSPSQSKPDSRYNPARAAPAAPNQQSSTRPPAAQRPAPSAPTQPSKIPQSTSQNALRQPDHSRDRNVSPNTRAQQDQTKKEPSPRSNQQTNGTSAARAAPPQQQQTSVQQPKPLNVSNKQTQAKPAADGRKAAEDALTTHPLILQHQSVRTST